MLLDPETEITEVVAEAAAQHGVVLSRPAIPDPRPTWVCRCCGSWVYFIAAGDSESIYPI